MGKRGPAAAPTELKLVRGDRKTRVNTREPKPSAGDVVMPKWLSREAAAVWKRLAPDLVKRRVLTAWDVDAFAAFCSAVVTHRVAAADAERHGATVIVPVRTLANGDVLTDVRKNPAWAVARESAQLIATLGGRFGLNPSDRSQLVTNGDEDGGEGQDPGRLLS